MVRCRSFPVKVLAVSLAILIPATSIAADCAKSRMMGEMDADAQHGTGGWFAGGVASGVLLGLIGTGIITATAAFSGPQPKFIPPETEQTCYMAGYKSKAKSKNTWSALGGGLLGTLVFVVIYVGATAD